MAETGSTGAHCPYVTFLNRYEAARYLFLVPQKLTPAAMKRAVEHLKAADPVLREIIERVGPPNIPHREATFGAVARSIAFQQLNGKAATTIFERLLKECHNCNAGSLAVASKMSGE